MNERTSSPSKKPKQEDRLFENLFPSLDAEVFSTFFQPFAPLAAQFLWLIQPMMGVFGHYDATHRLAEQILLSDSIENQEPHQTDEG